MKPTLQKTERTRRGFTLVETLVAIAVLMIAVVGPFYALQSALNASYSARDQLMATALAQEGLEYVRDMRDNNYLAGRTWLYNLDGSGSNPNCLTAYNAATPTQCMVDIPLDTVSLCSSTCTPLNLYANGNTYYYTQDTSRGSPSPYTGSVEIIQVNNAGDASHEVQVIVTVSWNFHGVHSTTVNGYLENWL